MLYPSRSTDGLPGLPLFGVSLFLFSDTVTTAPPSMRCGLWVLPTLALEDRPPARFVSTLSSGGFFVIACIFYLFISLCSLVLARPALLMGRSLKKARPVETLDTTSIFSGPVLSREWSVESYSILIYNNEIKRELHDKDFRS